MSDTGLYKFGPDPDKSTLPLDVQACLTTASEACDTIMGRSGSDGFCNQEDYMHTTYCACVNAGDGYPCPMRTFAQCANNGSAYKPWWYYNKKQPDGTTKDQQCEKEPICINLVVVGGNNNVTKGITQQCGTIENITNAMRANPALAALAFILFILFIYTISASSTSKPRPAALSPPADLLDSSPAANNLQY